MKPVHHIYQCVIRYVEVSTTHIAGGLSSGIIPANHNFNRMDIAICLQGRTAKGIVFDDYVWDRRW